MGARDGRCGGKARVTEIPGGSRPPQGQGTGNGDSGGRFAPPDPPTTSFQKKKTLASTVVDATFGQEIFRPKNNLAEKIAVCITEGGSNGGGGGIFSWRYLFRNIIKPMSAGRPLDVPRASVRRAPDVGWTSVGHSSDVRRTSAARPADVRRTSAGRSSDVRWTSAEHPRDVRRKAVGRLTTRAAPAASAH